MKRIFVVNPKAGRGIGPRQMQMLEDFFRQRGEPFDAAIASSRTDTVEQTRKSLRAGADQIVAVGGDGTLNAVANGFFEDGHPVRREATLAIARMGSGSDYFRGMCQEHAHDWRDIVLKHTARPVDVVVVHRPGDPRQEPLYLLNMLGVGMSAEVVRRKQRLPTWLPRSLRYFVPTLPNLFYARVARIRLEADGQAFEDDAVAVFVAKGTFAGGGMRFGGGVSLDDGQLDVTVVRPMSPWTMLVKTPKLYSGNFAGDPAIEKLKASRLRVTAEPALPAEFDGEFHDGTPLEISVLPRAIQVCFP